jgi:DNA uptake protein ComE-like DNA-binding protein
MGVSRSEANGLMILFPLMFFIVSSSYFYRNITFKKLSIDKDLIKRDSILSILEDNFIIDSTYQAEENYSFYKQNYLSKKRFENPKRKEFSKKPYKEYKTYVKKPLEVFDINLADTTSLKRIPGIGKVLSNRILKYRDMLGGFISVNQLKEVYGLNDTVLWALDTLVLIDSGFFPTQLAVNESDEFVLSKHPYISKTMAKLIANYRFQHGNFGSADELKNIHILDTLKLKKVLPYLKF